MAAPWVLHEGDCLTIMRTLSPESVHCCITSPPYYGLRDYGVEGQIGLEETPEEYVTKLVEAFREVRRVLRDDGTLWLNLGDAHTSGGRTGHGTRAGYKQQTNRGATDDTSPSRPPVPAGLKPKDLMGIPWRVAFALQADGWWLRSDIIWHKPNPMPESVTDRPTKSHEYVFLLAKRERYYYDARAVQENATRAGRIVKYDGTQKNCHVGDGVNDRRTTPRRTLTVGDGRNRRSVWTVATEPYKGAHFATFPTRLIEPMISAGTSEKGCCPRCGAPWGRVVERTDEIDLSARGSRFDFGKTAGRTGGERTQPGERYKTVTVGWRPGCRCDAGEPVPCTVLDPFAGTGTTGLVAIKHGRRAVLIELNPVYCDMARTRLRAIPGRLL